MKFLCDRCKTRYSIGDDRVRGKILKIRCKNCANVITVREGMADPDAMEASAPPGGEAGGAAQRRVKPTTMSPPIVTAAPAAPPTGALGAAFASAMTKPPPALEEEWYVSIEGEQEGPYSLTEAQRWIGTKAWDAELHCWSEGFDDWLPVDKVSHFRGLRKKPAPPAGPPPLPRATGAQQALRATGGQPALRTTSTGPQPALRATSTGPQPRLEEEPKPLFAATMASLEKGAAAAAAANGGASTAGASAKLGLPPPPSNGTPPGGQGRYPSPISGTPALPSARSSSPIPSVTPPSGQPRYPSPIGGSPAIPSISARTNGTGPSAKLPTPSPTVTPPPITTPAGAPAPKLGAKSGPVPRLDRVDRVDAKPAGNGFDVADAATQIESPPFELEAQTKAEPVASQAKANDAFGRSLANAPITDDTDNDDDDDSLQIGEVSRVVNLADLARSAPKKKATTSTPALARTGAVAKLNATNSVPRIDVDGASPAASAQAFGLPGAAPGLADEPHAMAMQPAPPAQSHKKGMIILIGVSTLLVAGVIIAVVMLGGGGDDKIDQGLRRSDTIDTTRPDDPLRPRMPGDTGPGSAATGPVQPKNPIKRPNNTGGNTTGGNQVATNPGSGSGRDEVFAGGDSLSPDDIDSVSKKYSTGTQRCYMRAQKGVDAITIGNVKSIQATLTVAKDGSVSEVALASHADDNLGKCLMSALKGWRFRANPGGRVKFTLAFANQ